MSKNTSASFTGFLFVVLCLFGSLAAYATQHDATGTTMSNSIPGPEGEELPFTFDPKTGKRVIPNSRCLDCHGDEKHKTDVRDDGTPVDIYVEQEQLKASVHSDHSCTDCHTTIDRVPHRKAPHVAVSCVDCHRQTWEKFKDDPEHKHERLGVVLEQIDSYMDSVHALPSKQDQSRTNATCYDCHEAHNVGELGSIQRKEKRLKNPEVCGRCHEKQLEE